MKNYKIKLKINRGFKFLVVILSFEFCVLSLMLARPALGASASLYLSPSTGTYTVGENFSIVIKVNTAGASINAAEGTLTFDVNALEVKSISKAGSILTIWTQDPVFSNSSGTISFGGGVPNPGFAGSAGAIITITFLAKINGTGTINFTSGAVLANDGKGTNILASMVGGTYMLQPKIVVSAGEKESKESVKIPSQISGALPSAPIIISATHPIQEKWYNNNSPEFNWDLPPLITGVSFKFDQNFNGVSGNVSDGLLKSKSFKNIDDGIWYFHLKFKNKTGWGPVSNYKIQIDTQPPKPFTIRIKDGGKVTSPTPILLFDTEDEIAGIEYYEVKIGEGDFTPIEFEALKHNPFQMPPQAPGRHTVIVRAVDKAGNSTLAMEEINIESIEGPKITEYPKRVESGNPITIQGTSSPKCLINIYYQGGEKSKEVIKVSTKANSSGFWEYILTKTLKDGSYNFWTEAMDEAGAISLPSETITILVQPPAFLKVGKMAIDYLATIITILILAALIIVGFFWSWQKARKYRASLKKETKEAEESLKKAMKTLGEDIGEKLKKLQKIKTERALNEEEEKIEKELKENLDVAQNYVAKEIKDM